MARVNDDQGAPDGTTTIVERGGNGGVILLAVVLLIAILIGGYFLLNQSKNDNLRTSAVIGAAHDVGSAAKKAGDAVDPNK